MHVLKLLAPTALALALTACPADPAPADVPADGADVAVDTTPDAVGDAEVTTDADAVSDVGPDTDAGSDADAGVDADAAVDADAGSDADAASDADATVDVSGDADADTTLPTCSSACDCPQGQACAAGTCTLGASPVFCCTQISCPDGDLCVTAAGLSSLCGATMSSTAGGLVFNELLIDGAVSGDPNGDSDPSDPMGDEFVEIVNASADPIALDGFTLEETTFVGLPRHTFGAGVTIGAGKAIVIFGGGTAPDDIPGTHFEVANAADVGISFGLALDDAGDSLTLRDASGDLVAIFAWGPSAPQPALSDRSYTRSPDVTGDFTPHDDAQTNVLYSPGTKADGTSF